MAKPSISATAPSSISRPGVPGRYGGPPATLLFAGALVFASAVPAVAYWLDLEAQ